MIIKRTFSVEVSEEYGDIGLRPLDMPNADTFGGMTAAHDLLEHEPDDDGSIAAEFRAFGAILWIRGNGGYYDSRGIQDPWEHVASDFPEMYRHFAYEGFSIDSAPDDVDSSDYIDLVRKGFQNIREGIHLDTDERDSLARFFAYRHDLARWIQIGYQNAEKRFSGHSSYSVCEIFQFIEDTLTRYLQHAEDCGRVIQAEFDTETLHVSLVSRLQHAERVDCFECDGTGEVDDETCPTCDGDCDIEYDDREDLA